MKLTALVPLPHGLHHLKVGDDFEEPDQQRADMLVYLQRAKVAEKSKPVIAAAPVVPRSPAAEPTYETKVAEAQSPVASGDVEPMRTKRTYTRRDLTAEK